MLESDWLKNVKCQRVNYKYNMYKIATSSRVVELNELKVNREHLIADELDNKKDDNQLIKAQCSSQPL